MNKSFEPLSPVAMTILLTLVSAPRHGYDIMKQVANDSEGRINMGPGTLYGALKRLVDTDLIRETDNVTDPRRRYYQLTKNGRTQLGAEIKRLQTLVNLAKSRQIVGMAI